MFHCRGGEGPDAIDFLSAMENWVEKNQAPEKLIAFKPKQTIPLPDEYRMPLAKDQVIFSRPVYAYPSSARYTGKGNANDAGTWTKK